MELMRGLLIVIPLRFTSSIELVFEQVAPSPHPRITGISGEWYVCMLGQSGDSFQA
ncbi:hypothetical protein AS9A_4018 [Hoyosella subflava DQS3-9A1]|uniref:Uncharacterized protein n=1 Tax=Hoyosella subflava (strain DSM 45089 / JCM 17490 / NBRC 109087 / DQS3-9A1) TaxID=443218 RepID=F6EIG0_HOYSD|nr:hypothetical protein AS9A_4018 [Hoyosella subflava DQS3-9A1]